MDRIAYSVFLNIKDFDDFGNTERWAQFILEKSNEKGDKTQKESYLKELG